MVQLHAESPGDTLSRLARIDQDFRRQIPRLRDLAKQYGDRSSQQLYALRDLEWEWTDAHLAAHPSIGKAGLFDDQEPCILCK
jgi:hypothetical protein